MKNMLKTVHMERMDIHTGDVTTDVYLQINTEVLRGDFIQKVGGATNFTVLMAIMAFANPLGESYPTQERIAEITGLSRSTVNRAIKELMDVTINRRKLLVRDQHEHGKFRNNVYKFMAEIVEEGEYMTAPEVLEYFMDKYREVYGVEYITNYGRDRNMIKSKLSTAYDRRTLRAMIDKAITEYDARWAKPAYPVPKITYLCGWLGNVVLKEIMAEQKKEAAIQERMNVDLDAQADIASKYI